MTHVATGLLSIGLDPNEQQSVFRQQPGQRPGPGWAKSDTLQNGERAERPEYCQQGRVHAAVFPQQVLITRSCPASIATASGSA